MNETIQTLISRRSIRKYKAEQIPESDLQQILEAGMYAASGMGIQPVTMVVVPCTARQPLSSCWPTWKNRPTHGPTAAWSWATS